MRSRYRSRHASLLTKHFDILHRCRELLQVPLHRVEVALCAVPSFSKASYVSRSADPARATRFSDLHAAHRSGPNSHEPSLTSVAVLTIARCETTRGVRRR